jgi:hypothetical protein
MNREVDTMLQLDEEGDELALTALRPATVCGSREDRVGR